MTAAWNDAKGIIKEGERYRSPSQTVDKAGRTAQSNSILF